MAFHVPEVGRITSGPLGSDASLGNCGAFELLSPEPGWALFMICADGLGWEHVSVRAVNKAGRSRTPSWKEMCAVKAVCWDGEDVVMQLHPRRSEYVNQHPNVLHLWRPLEAQIPTPDPLLVGVREQEVA